MVTTLLARRSQFHQTILVGHATPGSQSFQNVINSIVQRPVRSGMSAPDALLRAHATFYQAVQAQAATLAYIDIFKILALGAAIMLALSFLLRKNDPRAGRAAAVG